MARSHGLEQLIRDDLRFVSGLSEKAMFGGLAWLLDGKLLCGARDIGLMVRLGKGNDGWALEIEGVTPMTMRNRSMPGWVWCDMDVFAADDLRQKFVERAVDFVRTLPEK